MSDDSNELGDAVGRHRARAGDLETECETVRDMHNEMADIVEELDDAVDVGYRLSQ